MYFMPLTKYAYTFILKSQSFNECCEPLTQKQAYDGNLLWWLPTCNGLNTFTWVIMLWKRPWSRISLWECLWELLNKCRCARWFGFNGLCWNTQLQWLQLTSLFWCRTDITSHTQEFTHGLCNEVWQTRQKWFFIGAMLPELFIYIPICLNGEDLKY